MFRDRRVIAELEVLIVILDVKNKYHPGRWINADIVFHTYSMPKSVSAIVKQITQLYITDGTRSIHIDYI